MNKLTPQQYLDRFQEITKQMYEITKAKNSDYSGTELAFRNFEMVELLWICPTPEWILVRMTDKITRISNLLKAEAKVKDEKVADTLLDLANYSIILAIYLQTSENNITITKE